MQRVDDDRLRAVVDVVHGWLFGEPAPVDGVAHQAPAVDPLAVAIGKAKRAIKDSSGPTRRTLESVWLPEIDNATRGDTEARRRLVEVWAGDDLDARPALRVVG